MRFRLLAARGRVRSRVGDTIVRKILWDAIARSSEKQAKNLKETRCRVLVRNVGEKQLP